MNKKTYYTASEISEILGVCVNTAYQKIRALNLELKEKGYVTVAGKINKKYFNEKYYGGVEDEKISDTSI